MATLLEVVAMLLPSCDVAYDGGIQSGLCAMTRTSGFCIDSSLCAMTHALDVMMKYCTVLHPGNMYYRTVSVFFRVSVQCRKNEMQCSAKLVVHGPPKGPNKSVSNSIILGTTGAARAPWAMGSMGLFELVRIHLDQVSAQTVGSGPES